MDNAETVVNVQKKFCAECGNEMNAKAEICPSCGIRCITPPTNTISKVALLLITFFLGGLGGHKLYQKKYGLGVLYFLFCWTGIPGFAALIEFIIYCFKSEDELAQLYPAASGKAIVLALVMPIIGIFGIGAIAAIAMPQFSAYRLKAFNSAALSDLKSCQLSAEAYFAEESSYPTQISQMTCNVSNGTALYYLFLGKGYQVVSFHENGDTAYLANSNSLKIKTNTRAEIENQISEKAPETLNSGFHFINL
ncbi:MAG TPA: hypothetical protein DD412_01425 [Holosporales bacterium]|nr:hypothetical protein [Holosporales bacterium]